MENNGKELALTEKQAGVTLFGKGSQVSTDLLDAIDGIKSFSDGVDVINNYAAISKNAWVATALVVHKTLQIAGSNKDATKLMTQFAEKLRYKIKQMYNYRKAGRMVLADIISGKIKSIDDLPTNMADYIRPPQNKPESVKTYVVVAQIGQIDFVSGTQYVYACHIDGNEEKKATAAADKIDIKADNKVVISVAQVDGKQVTTITNGVEKVKTDSGETVHPRAIKFKILPL